MTREVFIDLVRRGMAVAQAPRLLAKFRGGIRVVIYHHIAEPCVFTRHIRVSTPPELFESHIKRLSRDYDIVSLDDVLEGTLPERPLLVTFDDAYRSVLDTGAPVLKAYGARPVFFIITSPVFEGEVLLENLLSYAEAEAPDVLADVFGVPTGTGAQAVLTRLVPGLSARAVVRLRDRLAMRIGASSREWRRRTGLYLDPSDLPSLADAGFSFGFHTRTHVRTRGIRGEELETEITEPLRRIAEATGRPVRAFSFPFGGGVQDATPEVLEALRSHGVKLLFFVGRRTNRRSAGPHLFRSDVGDLDDNLLTSEIEVMPILGTMYAKLRRRAEP